MIAEWRKTILFRLRNMKLTTAGCASNRHREMQTGTMPAKEKVLLLRLLTATTSSPGESVIHFQVTLEGV